MAQNEDQAKLAVIIDADNSQPAIIDGLIAEIAKYGNASVKRIYGDWTSSRLNGWKDSLLKYSIQPIQQFAYTTGKNATDSAMIIDAMDLLYTANLDGFCIVSSDSDFTRLASRIKEAGLTVFGFGERKTPAPFVSACDRFIYTEILRSETSSSGPKKKSAKDIKGDTKLMNLLRTAAEDSADESGWAFLGVVGNHIAKISPEFDPRNHGFTKLGDLYRATQLFDIDERSVRDSPAKQLYVKLKERKTRA